MVDRYNVDTVLAQGGHPMILDESHPLFPVIKADMEGMTALLRGAEPGETASMLCTLVMAAAAFLEMKGAFPRENSGAVLAQLVTVARSGGQDGSGTLDAMQAVAEMLMAPKPSEGTNAAD